MKGKIMNSEETKAVTNNNPQMKKNTVKSVLKGCLIVILGFLGILILWCILWHCFASEETKEQVRLEMELQRIADEKAAAEAAEKKRIADEKAAAEALKKKAAKEKTFREEMAKRRQRAAELEAESVAESVARKAVVKNLLSEASATFRKAKANKSGPDKWIVRGEVTTLNNNYQRVKLSFVVRCSKEPIPAGESDNSINDGSYLTMTEGYRIKVDSVIFLEAIIYK